MFQFSSAFFWYKLLFVSEILAGESIFIFLFSEKSKIWLRGGLSLFFIYLIAFLMPTELPFIQFNFIYISIMFVLLFIPCVISIKICYNESYGVVLFCGIMAYTIQHLSYITSNFLCSIFKLNIGSVYDNTISNTSGILLLIESGIFLIFFTCLLIFIRCCYKNRKRISVNYPIMVIISLIVFTFEIFLNAMVVFMKLDIKDTRIIILIYIYGVIICFLIIGLLMLSVLNNSLKAEKNFTIMMWNKEKECYNIKKDKIKEINIMCHDLKHRINEIEQTGYESDQLKKLEKTIKKYDMLYDTGNEILNTVLAEANIYCEKNSIRLMCMADGKCLNFMSTEHIYSLFDNAIHNAIEAVLNVKEIEKRFVKLKIVKKGTFVSIHLENYYEKNLYFKDGIPVTTKSDKEKHGFGMQSIKKIAEYYNGGINICAKNNVFILDIFFPSVKND